MGCVAGACSSGRPLYCTADTLHSASGSCNATTMHHSHLLPPTLRTLTHTAPHQPSQFPSVHALCVCISWSIWACKIREEVKEEAQTPVDSRWQQRLSLECYTLNTLSTLWDTLSTPPCWASSQSVWMARPRWSACSCWLCRSGTDRRPPLLLSVGTDSSELPCKAAAQPWAVGGWKQTGEGHSYKQLLRFLNE